MTACLAAAMLACGGSGSSRRASLLLITVDSLRADRIGASGYAGAETPQMDALAARGTIVENVFAPVPEATPSAASLLTGLYPSRHGIGTAGEGPLSAAAVTLAQRLKPEGYRTGAVAGALLLHPKYGLARGFDRYEASFIQIPHPSQLPEVGVLAESVADLALEFLETAREGPFFLWINFYDPHDFHSPPEPFASRFRDNPYDGEIAYVDRELGRVLAKLKDYGLESSTVVVLAGTNGEGLGEGGEDLHGVTLQPATTRVPLVMAGPGLAAGARLPGPASLVDVAPTVLSLLGVEVGADLDGVLITGDPDPDRPIYQQALLPARLFGWAPLVGVVSGRWQYVEGTRGALRDLASDAGTFEDAGDAHPDVRDRLAALARAYAAGLPADRPMPEAAATAIRALGFDTEPAPRKRRDPRDAIGLANDALKLHRQLMRRSVPAATFLVSEIARRDPDNFLGLLAAGLLAGARQDLPGARAPLARARDLYPAASEVYFQLAHLTTAEGAGQKDETAREAWRARATDLFRVAAALDPLNEEALYNVACAEAVAGDRAAALGTLERAVAAGFRDFDWMAVDRDLDSLRDDPRFDRITEGKARKTTEGG